MIGLIVFIGLIFLILVHEFGHFFTAKLFGIKVDEFGIGFPPKIFSKKYRGTLYSLNSIPFGGFVRIFGESPLDEASSLVEKKQSFAY
ncbi:MAG: RIP metalloprotease RseP, partial [Candidatus Liptonbacteria bacterium CG11_big_fil_rev_8_21_14_0_20_35_14]